MVLALERKELQSVRKSAYKNYAWKNVAVKIKENDLTLLSRELDRLGYETLGKLVRDLMLGKITNLTEEKQIEAMKSNLQSSGQNTAQLGGHYDFYKNIDVEDMLKECMKRYHPKTARCFVSYFGRYSDIIAVSVDCNATNCTWGSASNIEARADLIIASIAYFQSLDSDASSIFYQKIDFQSISLMGHSRGGDAVVLVPEVISLPNTKIKAVISLAPTDFGASRGKPRNYAFMTILPAGDGDVVENDGAKFYDQAIPEPLNLSSILIALIAIFSIGSGLLMKAMVLLGYHVRKMNKFCHHMGALFIGESYFIV